MAPVAVLLQNAVHVVSAVEMTCKSMPAGPSAWSDAVRHSSLFRRPPNASFCSCSNAMDALPITSSSQSAKLLWGGSFLKQLRLPAGIFECQRRGQKRLQTSLTSALHMTQECGLPARRYVCTGLALASRIFNLPWRLCPADGDVQEPQAMASDCNLQIEGTASSPLSDS